MPSKEEISDKFDLYHSFNILSLLDDIKKDYQGLPILNYPKSNIESEFIELIKFNIDYRDFFTKNND